jgi:hypothetical protein
MCEFAYSLFKSNLNLDGGSRGLVRAALSAVAVRRKAGALVVTVRSSEGLLGRHRHIEAFMYVKRVLLVDAFCCCW